MADQASPPPQAPISSAIITQIAAPLLFGPLVNWGLFGVLCVQTYVYSYNFPNDRLLTKAVVGFILALETIQTALTAADAYYWFVSGYGNPERFRHSHYAPLDIPITCSIISLIVQTYFSYRIWALTKNRWLCSVITISSVISTIGGMWGGIATFRFDNFVVPKVAIYLWSIASSVADILIAMAMTWQFRQSRVVEGLFSRFVLGRVVRLTVETNLLTATVAVVTLILYITMPNEVYYAFTSGIIGKLYSNTLLASLNNRIFFRDRASSRGSRSTESGDRSRTAATSSRARGAGFRFSPGESQEQSAGVGEAIMLEPTLHTFDPEKGKGDAASTSSEMSRGPLSSIQIHVTTGQTVVA